MTIYFGETIRCRETIKDFDGVTLLDPSSNEIKIYDASGDLKKTIPNEDIDREELGIFHGEYTLPNVGVAGSWYYVWKATFEDGSLAIERTDFVVAFAP
jgi:uncharacterized protein YfaS (alpha-2-macroglobulin family)